MKAVFSLPKAAGWPQAGQLRRHAGWLVLLALIGTVYYLWTWTDQLGALDSDGPAYLMMARHYANGAADHSAASIAASFARFPPLYPLLLSWLHAANDLRIAHAVTTTAFLLALAALYGWLMAEGVASWLAALAALVVAALPASWLAGLIVQSEYLYLLPSLLALAALSSYQRSRRDELLQAAALAVAAAIMTRSIGVALLPALFAMMFRAPRRSAGLALCIALGPTLLWSATHPGSGYLGSMRLAYQDMGLVPVLGQLGAQALALCLAFVRDAARTPLPLPLVIALPLWAALGLGAAAWRARKLEPDGLYALAYLGVLLLWPYPEENGRLLWPLLPILLGQVLILAQRWPGRLPPVVVAALCGAILLCTVPTIALAGQRYDEAAASGHPEFRGMLYWYESDPARARRWVDADVAIAATLQRADTEIPASDCVLSVRPELVNYFAARHSTYPPADAEKSTFETRLRSSGCRYVFMTQRTYAGYPAPMYPMRRLEREMQIVDRCDNDVCALGRLD